MASRASVLSGSVLSRLSSLPGCSRLTSPLGQNHILASCRATSLMSAARGLHHSCFNNSSNALGTIHPASRNPLRTLSCFGRCSDSSQTQPLLGRRSFSSIDSTATNNSVINGLSVVSGSNFGLNLGCNPSVMVEQRRFYQAALKPRLICPGCYFVWRHGRKHVECSDHPRHKQMKRVAKRKMWKEDYGSGDWVRALDWHKVHHRQEDHTADRMVLQHNWLAGKLGKEL